MPLSLATASLILDWVASDQSPVLQGKACGKCVHVARQAESESNRGLLGEVTGVTVSVLSLWQVHPFSIVKPLQTC